MVDITMCNNEACNNNKYCFRFTAPPGVRQSFCNFSPTDGVCIDFIRNDVKRGRGRPRGSRGPYGPRQKTLEILGMYDWVKSLRKVAKAFGCSHQNVALLVKRHKGKASPH